jgi:AraC-like DNA-binding protein
MDVLSEVLRAVRLNGAVFFDLDVKAPWAVASPPTAEVRARLMPEAESLIPFHFVMAGTAWLQTDLPGYATIALGEGDIVLLPRGHAHFIGSDRVRRVEPNLAHYRRPDDEELPFRVGDIGGAEGPGARIVCGYFGCDAGPFNPLLDALPPVTHIRPHSWHECLAATFISAALNERNASRPGREAILARLSELMLLQAIRIHIATLPEESEGWLSGLRDPQIGRVLQLIHAEPGRDWTLASLAAAAGMSRSVLAERFTRLVKLPPMQYLARWRMQLATHALMQRSTSIAGVAAEVGYESEAAFNRAFKRVVGVPPGQWRRSRSDAA